MFVSISAAAHLRVARGHFVEALLHSAATFRSAGSTMSATSLECGRAWSNVTIVSRDFYKLQSAADEISSESGNKVNINSIDVSKHNQIEELCLKLRKDNNFPNIIINNAAGNFLCPSEHLSYNAWNRVLDIVLKGTIDTTLTFGKEMIRNNETGTFINISTTY